MEADSTNAYSILSLNTTNQTSVTKGPTALISIHAINVNAAIRYLKFYDIRGAPVAGTGVPVRRFGIPGNTAGAGFNLTPVIPMKFLLGMAFTLTTGIADTDATAVLANEILLTLEWA